MCTKLSSFLLLTAIANLKLQWEISNPTHTHTSDLIPPVLFSVQLQIWGVSTWLVITQKTRVWHVQSQSWLVFTRVNDVITLVAPPSWLQYVGLAGSSPSIWWNWQEVKFIRYVIATLHHKVSRVWMAWGEEESLGRRGSKEEKSLTAEWLP